MSEFGMFVGWGEPIAGRERQGIAVFGEALEYVGGQQQAGVIEDHQVGVVPAFFGSEGVRLVEAMEGETTDLC